MENLYVWYSNATDVTGKLLAERLECECGTKKPSSSKNVICWGTKTTEDITLNNPVVLNHPNNIRVNRNKFTALKKMSDNDCNVAPFTTDTSLIGDGDFSYPIIARTKYHQGGAGFWLCLNNEHVSKAVEEGAQYFQKYINIKDEYRLHVVKGKIIYAVKKVPRDNLKEAFKAHWKKVISNYAAKKEVSLDENTFDFVLNRFARKMATSVDMIVRSNTRGWKFSRVKLTSVREDLKEEARKALEGLGLDFGAVDCCIDIDKDKPYVIECNTGPGLEGSSLDAWVSKFEKIFSEDEVVTNTDSLTIKGKAKKTSLDKKKKKLKEATKIMDALINAASNEEEINALSNLLTKAGLA